MAVMITTMDNPYDPRTDFDQWMSWDEEQGYYTCAYLDRMIVSGPDFPDKLQDRFTEEAIDRIIALHAGGMYKKLEVGDPAQIDENTAE